MADNRTWLQRLNQRFRGDSTNSVNPNVITSSPSQGYTQNRILYSTNDKADYEKKLKSYQQQKFMAYQWKKVSADNAMESLSSYVGVKLMFRDADLMETSSPEIGTALDIVSEEACPLTSKGKMLNIESSSKRIKSILEDLFTNRLHIYTDLPMVARDMCKYGNEYMFLNVDAENGIMGWKKLPVYEMDRNENGFEASYAPVFNTNSNEIKEDEITFIRRGVNEDLPYRNWQVAHFRLLKDSFFLPYGTSMLHKARRAWRMWSMMEDAMLIWRLDKAIERRVYKIFVGGIDDADVKAYVDEIANNFKRTAIVDPETGQLDLRKNFLDVSSDYFIPVRREDAPNPIETLQGAQSQVQMEDIEYMQNKIFAALRVPKTFLNFQEAQGKGQNLSIMDIRFARMVNTIQQFLLMELNKIAQIHLYIMGLGDEIGNFELSLNNPSNQIEALEIEDLTKRLAAMQTALTDPGIGMPMMSYHKACREILKMPDSEIMDMVNEIRLEKAMAAELAATQNVIKKTGLFDKVDRIYGDVDVLLSDSPSQAPQQGDQDGMGGGPGGGGAPAPIGGGDMGDMDMDMGGPGSEGENSIGAEGVTDMAGAPAADAGNPMEGKNNNKPLLNETKANKVKSFTERYFEILAEGKRKEQAEVDEENEFDSQNEIAESKIKELYKHFDKLATLVENKEIIDEATDDLSGKTIDGAAQE